MSDLLALSDLPAVALTVDQPFASLLVQGAKRWETRPLPPGGVLPLAAGHHRMPGHRLPDDGLLTIHASGRVPRRLVVAGLGFVGPAGEDPVRRFWWGSGNEGSMRLPQGVVLGAVRVLEVVPIVSDAEAAGIVANESHGPVIASGPDRVTYWPAADPRLPLAASSLIAPAEVAMGDWSPGRWAWRCAPAGRLERPVPVRGSQGLWLLARALPNQSV